MNALFSRMDFTEPGEISILEYGAGHIPPITIYTTQMIVTMTILIQTQYQ